MFNRDNMPNPFSGRSDGSSRVPSNGVPPGHGRFGEQQPQRNTAYGSQEGYRRGYTDSMEKVPARAPVGRQVSAKVGGPDGALLLRPAKSPDNSFTFGNR